MLQRFILNTFNVGVMGSSPMRITERNLSNLQSFRDSFLFQNTISVIKKRLFLLKFENKGVSFEYPFNFNLYMATLSLTIFKAKQLANGKHKIRIAVRHRHETSYIITPYMIDDISQFKDGRVIKKFDADIINMRLRTLLNKYQERLDDIDNIHIMSAKDVKNSITNFHKDSKDITIGEICKEYVNELREDNRKGYAELIERCGSYFLEFLRGDMSSTSITPATISNFERFLRTKKRLNQTTIGMYLTRLRVLVNFARKRYLIKQDIHPFHECKIPQSLERYIDITLSEFNKFQHYVPTSKIENIAKDLWFLSFYLGGINLIDLTNIHFRDDAKIEYTRTKTKNTKRGEKRIELTIPIEAKYIIDKYKGSNDTLEFGYNFSYNNFSRYVGRTISKIGKKLNIQRLCYYSARKTFVQFGFEIGIPLEILEYTIGQSMKQNRPIYNYIRIMRKHADEAIQKIIIYSSQDRASSISKCENRL